jgi:hypothetical protein
MEASLELVNPNRATPLRLTDLDLRRDTIKWDGTNSP